jgi:hypothetical protein
MSALISYATKYVFEFIRKIAALDIIGKIDFATDITTNINFKKDTEIIVNIFEDAIDPNYYSITQ